ncbi:LysR family transcriptional regulator [Roseateles oligotrophus]|uniref:LysR family transcriptional regulator n=1 Tax=Roseateles oligotrophus TaxID=1769250 RepID=A0ABT2YH71_9BURK|nr:LysR family transcriptional regulator [Roseateles oligotrophus]MCV2369373.1 LysR family transcriptional regulator [Roseateles oligotrophus]
MSANRLQLLTIFVTLVEAGSVAAAAQKLERSASTVRRTMAALEQQLAVALILRPSRKLKLTPAGERYFEDCRRILNRLAYAEETVSKNLDPERGRQDGRGAKAPDEQ